MRCLLYAPWHSILKLSSVQVNLPFGMCLFIRVPTVFPNKNLTFPVNHTPVTDLYCHTFQYRKHTMNTSKNYLGMWILPSKVLPGFLTFFSFMHFMYCLKFRKISVIRSITGTFLPSELWRCWLGGGKGIRPVKTEWWGAGVVICLDRGADLHTVQLMPVPLTVSCSSKIQIGFSLVPAHPGSPGQRAV